MTRSAEPVTEFLKLNRELSTKRSEGVPPILVDAAYRDPYIVACTMKIAHCVATLTNRALVVVTSPTISRETAEIVDSFGPLRVVSVKDLAIRGARARWGVERGALDSRG